MAPATERVAQALPLPFAGGRLVASPFQFVTTGEDNIRVVAVNALTGVKLKLQGLRYSATEGLHPYSFDHTPNSDRTTTTQDYQLGVGALLSLTVFASAGAPTIGQTFVMVQIIRGIGSAAIVLGTLLSGYVTNTQGLGWPGSPNRNSLDALPAIRIITGTQPAVGVTYTETVPTGARWRLLSFQVVLTTSAAAGNRQPILDIFKAGPRIIDSPQAHLTGPSSLFTYFWLPGLPVTTDFTPSGPGVAGLPTPCDLPAGTGIRDNGVNIAAGDQWSAPVYLVEEWLDF